MTSLVQESNIASLETYFSDLPSMPPAPDDSTGIAIHADIGQACSNATLCGNWGGVNSAGYDVDGPTAYHKSYVVDHDLMDPVRRGLFHYVYETHDHPPQYAGEAYTPSSTFWVEQGIQPQKFAHELGHDLGLHHSGSLSNGAVVNYKEAYPSLMNYANGDCLPCTPHHFSDGSGPTLNHLDLDETTSTGLDADMLEVTPDLGGAFDLSLTSDGSGIDWNGDGRKAGAPVRADISPVDKNQYVVNWPANTDVGQVSSTALLSGPGLASYSDQYATFFYAFGVYEDAGTNRLGLTWSGSSPSWGSMTPLPLSFTPSANGETAAATVGEKILVLSPIDSSNALGYAIFDTTSTSVTESGAIPGWPSGATARQASVAAVGGKLVVVFRDKTLVDNTPTNNVWQTTWDPATDTWSAWVQPADANGAKLKSQLAPGVAAGPDGDEYLETVGDSGQRTLYRGAPGADMDDVLDDGWPFALPANGSRPRLNLVFLPYLNADGSAFSDGSEYPVTYYADGGYWYRIRARGYADPSGPQLTPDANWHSQKIKSGGATISTASSESVGVATSPNGDADLVFARSDGTLWIVPHASGIAEDYPYQNSDNNDAYTMACNMCSVWNLTGQMSECQGYEPLTSCPPIATPLQVSCH